MATKTTAPKKAYVVKLGAAGESIRQFDAPNDQQAELIAEQMALDFLVGLFGGVLQIPNGNTAPTQRAAVQSFFEKTFPGFMLRSTFGAPSKVGGTSAFTPIIVTLIADDGDAVGRLFGRNV